MFRKFIDREEELAFLERKHKEEGFQFIVLYGRRRVGKTQLVKEFVKDKERLYFLADKSGTESNLERFKERIADFLHEPKPELYTFEKALQYLSDKCGNRRVVVAIDEFSYLVEKDDSIPSVFQLAIDEYLEKSNIFLILLGSSVSLMETGVLSKKSPLYGRRTGQFKLLPLPLAELAHFFPHYGIKERIEAYSCFGGVPFYLAKIDGQKTIIENIKERIFRKGEVMYEEVDFLLKEELREPSTYKAILEAIASGRTKTVEIANKARIDAKDMDKYLKTLINLGFLEKKSPVTEKAKTKKSIYVIGDNFFDFWFTFCFPNRSDLEIGDEDKVMGIMKGRFNGYLGKKFEDVCREFVSRKLDYNRVGTWWGNYRDKEGKKVELEIDIVALNETTDEILFAECKWQDNVNAEALLLELKEKAKQVMWKNSERKEHYALFARSFRKKAHGAACFSLHEMGKK